MACRIAEQDWMEKRGWKGQDSHVTRVSLIALAARLRHFTTNRHEMAG